MIFVSKDGLALKLISPSWMRFGCVVPRSANSLLGISYSHQHLRQCGGLTTRVEPFPNCGVRDRPLAWVRLLSQLRWLCVPHSELHRGLRWCRPRYSWGHGHLLHIWTTVARICTHWTSKLSHNLKWPKIGQFVVFVSKDDLALKPIWPSWIRFDCAMPQSTNSLPRIFYSHHLRQCGALTAEVKPFIDWGGQGSPLA